MRGRISLVTSWLNLWFPSNTGARLKYKMIGNSDDVYEIVGRCKDGTTIPIEVRGMSIELSRKPAHMAAITYIKFQME